MNNDRIANQKPVLSVCVGWSGCELCNLCAALDRCRLYVFLTWSLKRHTVIEWHELAEKGKNIRSDKAHSIASPKSGVTLIVNVIIMLNYFIFRPNKLRLVWECNSFSVNLPYEAKFLTSHTRHFRRFQSACAISYGKSNFDKYVTSKSAKREKWNEMVCMKAAMKNHS